MEQKRNVLKYLAVHFKHRVWCPLWGYMDPQSGSGMTVEVLIRFPIGVGDDVRAGVRVVFGFVLLILIELNG